VALPAANGIAPGGTATQADACRIDCFLAERAKALALERHVLVANLAAREELLETVVDRARQHHAAQDFAALLVGERRRDRFASKKAGAGVAHVLARLLQSLLRRDAGRRIGSATDLDRGRV